MSTNTVRDMRLEDIAAIVGLPGLDSRIDDVEQRVVGTLADGHALLGTPSLRVARGGGKRLRAALVLAAADAVEPGAMQRDEVVRAAAAIELVHQGSLVHDDLLDGALARRGIATVNALEGLDRAILVGDYILAKAGALAASVSRAVAADVSVAIEALCEGQVLEMADVRDTGRSLERTFASIGGKTADLMLAASRIGARCVEENSPLVHALGTYGYAFGMSFQLIDDVLDVMSTSELLGKPVGNDIRCGVYTIPIILAREIIASPAFEDLLLRATTDDASADEALDAVRRCGAIERTVDLAVDHASMAANALDSWVPDHPSLAALGALPRAYLDWALAALVDGALDQRVPA